MSGKKFSRRSFLQGSCSAISSITLATTFLELNAFAELANASTHDDYKALVCVFLQGGNDCHNTILRKDSQGYNEYKATRDALSVESNAIRTIDSNYKGMHLGLHPNLPEIQSLINNGRGAAILNVGTLYEPVTKNDLKNKGKKIPRLLGSHSDQVHQWLTSSVLEVKSNGWGGKIGDILRSYNSNSEVASLISLGGTNVFQAGEYVSPLLLNKDGDVVSFTRGASQPGDLLESASRLSRTNILKQGIEEVVSDTFSAEASVNKLFETRRQFATTFPAQHGFSRAMQTVAELIANQKALGIRRQVFFVTQGGFDTHANQLDGHPSLLTTIDSTLGAFYRALDEIEMGSKVTTFTASEFGRTGNPSSSGGSDHGWGGHHFVLGGAVNAGVYGDFPSIVENSDDDRTGRSVLIPTIAVDQYAATLAAWLGVPSGSMTDILPNLNRFSTQNLGFLG